jgi:hypothetical protein
MAYQPTDGLLDFLGFGGDSHPWTDIWLRHKNEWMQLNGSFRGRDTRAYPEMRRQELEHHLNWWLGRTRYLPWVLKGNPIAAVGGAYDVAGTRTQGEADDLLAAQKAKLWTYPLTAPLPHNLIEDSFKATQRVATQLVAHGTTGTGVAGEVEQFVKTYPGYFAESAIDRLKDLNDVIPTWLKVVVGGAAAFYVYSKFD